MRVVSTSIRLASAFLQARASLGGIPLLLQGKNCYRYKKTGYHSRAIHDFYPRVTVFSLSSFWKEHLYFLRFGLSGATANQCNTAPKCPMEKEEDHIGV